MAQFGDLYAMLHGGSGVAMNRCSRAGVRGALTLLLTPVVVASVGLPTPAQAAVPASADVRADALVSVPQLVTASDRITSTRRPKIFSVSAASGPAPGGNRVTIRGKRFTHVYWVKFGATVAPVTKLNRRTLSVVVPAHPVGTVFVKVGTRAGRSIGRVTYTYTAPGPFVAPTSISYLGNTCTHPQDNYWIVTAQFAVSGGRYANIGDMINNAEHYDDNVYDGSTRIINSVLNVYGWPGPDPSVPAAMDIESRQMIAPIETQHDRSTWQWITHDFTVNVSCP